MARVYDWSTGVVYNESTSASVRTMALNWASQARGKSKKALTTDRTSGVGAAKLQAMALRSCVLNLELFTVEALKSAQWHYAGMIYRECRDRQALSFIDWSIFIEAFPNDIESYHHFDFHRASVDFDLITREIPNMAGKMARLETHNLSLLCIQNVCITFEHLVCFTRIPTLSGLFLAQLSESHAESVKEEHIKHWARTVRQRHAFQHLEVLVMSRFAIDMNDTINAVSPFPNLHLVGFAERSRYGSVLNSIDTASGTWKLYNSTLPEDPRHLWDSPNHTTKDKMRKLHASSRRIRQVVGLPEPTLGISYGASSNRFTQPSEWYMRTGKSRLEDVAKRRQGCEIDGIAQNVKKQRTVRAGKQADLNSLLGQFT